MLFLLVYCLFSGPVFSVSRRGNPVIILGEYRYNKWVGSRGSRSRWICVKVKGLKCPATLITIDDIIVKHTPHNH